MPAAIVFGHQPSGHAMSVQVDLDVDDAAKRLATNASGGYEQFKTTQGETVWINPRAVWYVTGRGSGGRS